MTRALTFDQATAATGWCFGTENSEIRPKPGSNDSYRYGVIKTPKRDVTGERLAILWREALGLIEEFEPDIIGYEEPFFPMQGQGSFKQKQRYQPSRGFLPGGAIPEADGEEDESPHRFNPETLKQLQMVKGLIITMAALKGVPAVGCTPSQWRATCLGYGRRPKGESEDYMKRAVRAHFLRLGFDIEGMPFDVSDAIGITWHTLHGKQAMERKQGDLLSMAGGLL